MEIKELTLFFSLSAFAEDEMFLGPRWITEPSDLTLPIDSPDQEVTIPCDAGGDPPPQYRSAHPCVVLHPEASGLKLSHEILHPRNVWYSTLRKMEN